MAWHDESTEILRIIINDFDDNNYTYSDNTLEQLLLVAARYVIQEINVGTDYVVDYFATNISPDPSDDHAFLNFVILKAACLTNTWTFNQKAIAEGIRAKCGPFAEMSVKGASDIVLGLIKEGPCKTYENLKKQTNFGTTCKAILTPFISNVFLPDNQDFRRSV